jgi:lipid A 4'-phosphatase
MDIAKIQITRQLARWDLLLCVLSGVVLHLFPVIDLWVSQQFYQDDHFVLVHDSLFVFVIYDIFASIHLPYLVVFVVGVLLTYLIKWQKAKLWRKRLSFLLLVLLLLPGVMVNLVLKNSSFGRPRPVQVEQFGGESQFAPVFVYSGQCSKNCSFVSGHAATAFFTIAFAWALGRRWIFVFGLVLGCIVSMVRLAQGAHFLSDVVFSFWVVYFGTIVLAYFYQFSIERCRVSSRVSVDSFFPGQASG